MSGDLWVLGEIAGETAHELRNALAVIAGSAALLRGASKEESARHVEKIERNARVAQHVIDAMMALARGEEIRGEPVALTTVIAEARRDVAGELAYGDDSVVGIEVRGSAILLSRMFRVMYENAFQAGARRVETRAHPEKNGAFAIDVIDDGPGVAREVAENIFDPLVTTRKEGTGLGLALARRVARAHGGDVTLVESDTGAHFRITLRA